MGIIPGLPDAEDWPSTATPLDAARRNEELLRLKAYIDSKPGATYTEWLAQGYDGTFEDYLESQKGPPGDLELDSPVVSDVTFTGVISAAKANLVPTLNVRAYGATGNGSTDDTSALQAALADAAAVSGGAKVYMPEGTYKISATLDIDDNVELFGAGPLSVIKLAASYGSSRVIHNADETNGNSNIRLHDFALDGNSANISGDPDDSSAPNTAILFTALGSAVCEGIFVERIYAHHHKRLGLIFQNVQGGACRDCVVEHNGRDGITVYFNTQRFHITGNRVRDCGDDHIGLNAENGTSTGHVLKDIVVANNILTGPSTRLKGRGITARGGSHIQITGNVIDSVSGDGIFIVDYNTTVAEHFLVANNVLRNIGQDGTGTKVPIFLLAGNSTNHASSTWGAVRNIQVTGNQISAAPGEGIVLRSDHAVGELENVSLQRNFIVGGGDGIVLGTKVRRVTVKGNLVQSPVGRGIVSTDANNAELWVDENVVRDASGSSGHGIQIESATDGTLRGNIATNCSQRGIRLRSAAGEWMVSHNHANDCTVSNYDFTSSSAVMPSLTAAVASTVDTTYGTEEAAVINNLRTRLGEVETRLKALEILAPGT